MSSEKGIGSKFDKILLRYGEIFLKGKNQNVFERKLINNIKKIIGSHNLNKLRSRYILDFFENHNEIKRVFGLVSYSLSIETTKNLEDIKKTALELIQGKKGTFRVETKRSDKSFPIKSPDLNRLIGEHIEENNDQVSFKLKDFDLCVNIEINQQGVYLFLDKISCFGGLPTGVEGEVSLLIENKASILAGLLMMKRGVKINILLPKNADEDLKQKSLFLLNRFSPDEIKYSEYNQFSEINKLLSSKNIETLVSGQNFENHDLVGLDKKFVILRPLIAFSDNEINDWLIKFESV